MFEIIQREEKQTSTSDGFISADGRVWGTYIHGVFDNDGFRQEFIRRIKEAKGISVSPEAHTSFSFQEFKETQYDALAELVRNNIDMEAFYRIAGLR
jgi:adenosylcobyric acid synthase